MNKVKKLVKPACVAAVIVLPFVLTGCTTTSGPVNGTALPGVVVPRVEGDTPAESGDVAGSAYPGRLPPGLRQELEAAWSALSNLPIDAGPEDVISASERFLAIAAVVEPLASCASESFWLGSRTREVRRVLLALNFAIRHDHWHSRYLEVTTYSEAIEMTERMLELLRETAASDLLSHHERFEMEQLIDQWRGHLALERERFRCQQVEVDRWIGRQQGDFANRMGRADLTEAKRLLESQDRKRFNWAILGRPRDNQSLIMVAVQRARRAAAAIQATPSIRAQAVDIVEQADARLSSEMRRRLHLRQPLPGYSTYFDYPRWSDDERSRLADTRMLDDEVEAEAVQHNNYVSHTGALRKDEK